MPEQNHHPVNLLAEPTPGDSIAPLATDIAKSMVEGVPLKNEIDQQPKPQNKVEELINSEFSDPALWIADFDTFDSRFVGLESDRQPPYINGLKVSDPSKAWIAGIYGSHIVPANIKHSPDALKLEFVEPKVISRIHTRLNEGILKGEGMRVAEVLEPPHPEALFNSDNVDFWLEKIRHNVWPIMLWAYTEGGATKPYSHDLNDTHLGNFALFPREVQDMITETTVHELAWRKKYHNGQVAEKYMLMDGETLASEDPWASGSRGNSAMRWTGVDKIDDISGAKYYMELLAYVVDNPEQECSERLASVLGFDPVTYAGNRHQILGAVTGAREMRGLIGDVANFNSRHRSGENASPELVEHEFEKFLKGVVRVAEKIRGEHPEAA